MRLEERADVLLFWSVAVGEVADVLHAGVLGSTVLDKIYPPIITFVGPKELTGQLTNPEIAGKPYTMTGQLYVQKRLFRLSSVESNEKEGEPAP